MPWLSAGEIAELVKAAVDSGLIEDVDRSILLQGIPAGFRLAMKKDASLLNQFSLDIGKVNDTEFLAGGLVPVVNFLQNAADQLTLRSKPQAELFGRKANEVGNRASGRAVTTLPAPSTLPEVVRNEAIVGRNDMVDFDFLDLAITAGRSIGRILVPKFVNGAQVTLPTGEPVLFRGTAWVIAPKLVITNLHVINVRKAEEGDASESDLKLQSENAAVEFGLDRSGAKNVAEIGVESIAYRSKDLDFAILRLREDPARPPLTLNPNAVKMRATSYLPVNIIQHPRGEPKRVAFRNNLVSGADETLLRYFTDTDFGSSGSPVCGDDWRVVALHRGAKYTSGVTYQGKDTAYVNFGSQIQAILGELKTKDADLYRDIMGA